MPKTKFWIILFSVLFLLGAGAFLLLQNRGEGLIAEIWLDGEVYDTVDLAAVAVPYDIVIETQHGSNTVHVQNGGISVSHADCRDQVCVRQGVISGPGIPVICLPHRLVIEIGGGP